MSRTNPITPSQLAASGTEHGHQAAAFLALRSHVVEFPELRWAHAVPNGGGRSPSVGAAMKAEGQKKGVFDVCLPVARCGFPGLYVELKIPGRERQKDGGLSEEQVVFEEFVKSQGYCALRAYGWEHLVRIILGYLRGCVEK